jgi:hypothetical protein
MFIYAVMHTGKYDSSGLYAIACSGAGNHVSPSRSVPTLNECLVSPRPYQMFLILKNGKTAETESVLGTTGRPELLLPMPIPLTGWQSGVVGKVAIDKRVQMWQWQFTR